MYDLSSQPHSAWHSYVCEVVPQSVREAVAHLAEEFTAAYLLDCLILEKGLRSRLCACATRTSNELLSPEERMERFSNLLPLWADGCESVVDERLFQDTARRRPQELQALRQNFRKNAFKR